MASTETKPVASEAHTLLSPGELVLKKIFAEFVALSNQKLRFITSQALVSSLVAEACSTRHTSNVLNVAQCLFSYVVFLF